MRYVSLFSGVECASVAWAPLGWEPICFAEVDPFASAVLAARFPDVPNVGDVTAHDWSQYRGKCDLVIGGSPCQSYSIAGLRRSLEDPRGQLTLAFVKACHEIDPAIVIWENVPSVANTHDNAFGCFLAGMVGASEPLSSGHRGGRWPDAGMVIGPQRAAAFSLLDAQFYGVPQRRKRLFLVAVSLSHPSFAPGKVPNPAAVLFNAPGVLGDFAPGGEAREEVVGASGRRAEGGGGCQPVTDGLPAVSGTLGGGSGTRGYANSPDFGVFIPVQKGAIEAHGGGEVVPAVTAKWAKGCGGPAGDETQNLVAFHATQDPTHYSHITPSLGCGSTNGQATVAVALADDTPSPEGVAVPLLEVGKRTGASGARHGAGIGIGNDGDPMYTLQASAKHGVVCAEEAVPLDLRNAQRDRRPDSRAPGGGTAGREGDPAFTVTAGYGPQAVAFSSKDSGADEGEVAPTLRAMGHDASHANGGGQVAVAVGYNGPTEIVPPIRAQPGGTLRPEAAGQIAIVQEVATVGGEVTHTLRAEGADASEDGTGRGTPVVAVHQNQSGELRTGAIANTLNTNGNATGRNSPLVATGLTVRRLTPRECERLQGLPDDWTLIPYGRARKMKDLAEMATYWAVTEEVAKTLAADSLRYKATGNGMAVPVIWWLGKRIEWVLAELAAWDGLFDDGV